MTDTRWLDHAEADAWIQLLAFVEYLPGVIDQQLRRDAGLNRFEYSILAMLSDMPDRTATMTDLSTVTFGSLSRLSHSVSKLVERGLVRRTRQGPSRHVHLSDAGWEAVRAAAPAHVAEVRRQLFDHVPPERAHELAEILRPAVDWLKANAPRD